MNYVVCSACGTYEYRHSYAACSGCESDEDYEEDSELEE